MSTQSPKCRLCGHVHPLGAPHIWSTEKGDKPAKRVHNAEKKPQKRVHSEKKTEDVYTVRQVNIRQLRANLAGELKDLPFDIVRNGKVVGRVDKPGGKK